jgi:hypothetical protein
VVRYRRRRDPPNGTLQLTDRTKDVIKSGGEWISSVELENAPSAIPPWPKPPRSACSTRGTNGRCWSWCASLDVGSDELRAFLATKVAKWWVPDDIVFVDEIPHTGTGGKSARRTCATSSAISSGPPEPWTTSIPTARTDRFKALPRNAIRMLNLVRFKDEATYPEGHPLADKGWTGAQAMPNTTARSPVGQGGGEHGLGGDFECVVTGPEEWPWMPRSSWAIPMRRRSSPW